MTELQRFDATSAYAAIMAAVDEDGAAIVTDFISPDLLARLNRELDADIEQRQAGSEAADERLLEFWGSNTKRFTRLAARAPSFAELLDHPLMHRWAEQTFDCDYWLNTGQAMIVGPGEKAQALHRDIGIWPPIKAMAADGPQVLVSILLALSDFTAEVGATRIVPGSHQWGDFERLPEDDAVIPAVMPAGSAVLYLGKTMHAAGANVTENRWRRGLHMSFVVGWLTPEEASPVGVPWKTARDFPPRVQQMLGYASPSNRRGQSPVNWLIDFEDTRHFLAAPG
jgi:ectoine hydroxylase-related dioxygenase (phytanoyl-CoA dioxygenase family)